MPIREYVCNQCGSDFEKIVRATQAGDDVACPSCGSRRLEKKLSSFSAHSGASRNAPASPMCPSGGVCATPGMCGMSRN
ncbi:MAG: zinc ribbon domain-containing protein [Bryobacterales bacterium]|nr:zinc ribbon domain-containing protein [Bryobacterales bacterium]